jgi:tetratricopeptide (TPR) repeat protein
MKIRPVLSATLALALSILQCQFAFAGVVVDSSKVKDKWAIVVGIDQFKTPGIDLQYAAEDAENFADFLKGAGGFRPEHVKLLTNTQATRSNILKLLGESWLPKVVDPDDLVVIYIGSHGSSSKFDIVGVNYIITHDSMPGSFYSTAISTQDFVRFVRTRVPAKNIVLILDTCYSGSAKLDNTGKVVLGGVDSDELYRGSGQIVVTSSSANQPSFESPKYKSGIFTHHFLNGLKINGKQTSLVEAFNYTRDKVKVDSEELTGGAVAQLPVMKCNRDAETLLLAQIPSAPHDGIIAGRADPVSIDDELTKSTSWGRLLDEGDQEYATGNLKEAETKYRQAVKLADVTFGDTDTRTATSLTSLSNILDSTGRSLEAEQATERALTIAKRNLGPGHAYVGNTLGNLCSIELTRGQYAKAEEYGRESVRILAKERPGSESLIRSLARLGQVLLYLEKYSEGEEYIQKALSLCDTSKTGGDEVLSSVFHKLGVTYRMQRKTQKSEECFRKSLEIRKRALPKDHPDIALTCLALGMLYNQTNEPTKARPVLIEAESIMQSKGMSLCPFTLAMLADCYALEKNHGKAVESFEQAISLLEQQHGEDDYAATVFCEYGKYLLGQKEYKAAIVPLTHGVKIRVKLGLGDSSDCAWHKLLLAKALRESNRLEDALKYCDEGLATVKKLEGAESSHYGDALVAHSMILQKMGRIDEASKEEAEGNRIVAQYEKKHAR